MASAVTAYGVRLAANKCSEQWEVNLVSSHLVDHCGMTARRNSCRCAPTRCCQSLCGRKEAELLFQSRLILTTIKKGAYSAFVRRQALPGLHQSSPSARLDKTPSQTRQCVAGTAFPDSASGLSGAASTSSAALPLLFHLR